ncbi:MAG: hypothetical protein IKI93_18600 [Clostridia bacterium]|nr:hypothetical protein [Clostridia bacterium]
MKGQAAHHQIHKIQILQLLNIAGTLEVSRIGRLIGIKPGNMETVLTQMQKAGKIVRSGNRIALDSSALEDVSPSSDTVMRVFSDFIHRSDYYTAGEYPAAVCFFADGEEYEIIYAEPGQENIIRKALSQTENPPLRLMIIRSADQIERLNIDNVAAYCMVDGETDEVRYYKMKERRSE